MIGLDVGLIRKTKPGNWVADHPRIPRTLRAGIRHRVRPVDQGCEDGAGTGNYIDGPGAWDGYAAAAVCAAGVKSLETGQRVAVDMVARDSVAGA